MNNLDDFKIVQELDRGLMRDVLSGFPLQCKQAFKLGKDFILPANFGKFRNILFCGMGGSAIGAEIVSGYLRKEIDIPIIVNRDYTIPGFVNQDCLVVLTSYSGNTEETLTAYQEAQNKDAKMIILTTGGKLGDLAKKDSHPFLTIPFGYPPRGALGFVSLPILAIFSQLHLIADQERQIEETITLLERLEKNSLGVGVKLESNLAKKLAQRIFGNFCVIYAAGEHCSAVATRWRGQLAENSKSLSSTHVFPEMNHNEIVGWQHPLSLLQKFVVVILRDKEDHPQVKKRMEISKEILQKEAIDVQEVWSDGEGPLARIYSLIYTGDYVSFYLALLNKEDPTPVKRIDYLKQRLKKI